MDAVQFGRWFSKRRQACGWQSQRTLVDAVRRDPFLKASGISEDFLARLEAGHLAHPFRSSVRRRVLALAWLLCKTPRDLQTYLRAAELNDLGAEEADQVQRLGEHLAVQQSPSPLLLPLRPIRLIGRSTELHELLNALCKKDVNVFAVTGMPGSGKSALAYETLHMLASDEHERVRLFPHGIATFTGRGRRGINGLISLLSGITTVFHSLAASDSNPRSLALVPTPPQFTDVDLACAIDRVRAALAGKRVLILLDDLEADFPLRQALETLLVRSQIDMAGHELRKNGDPSQERHVVLITSSYIPAPALVTSRLHLSPLKPEAALDLLANLVGRGMVEMERQHAERICAAVGYLPLAIEAVATAVLTKAIPFSLLAARVAERPLDRLLDEEYEIRSRLARTLAALGPGMQEQFALLSTLGTQSFGLAPAAAIHVQTTAPLAIEEHGLSAVEVASLPEHAVALLDDKAQKDVTFDSVDLSLTQLAHTAANLGQFVRSSLLELAPGEALLESPFPRYRLHPLLYAYAGERLEDLNPAIVDAVQGSVQEYALAYIERYQADVPRLECERGFLLASLKQAWQQEQYGQVIRFVAGLSPIIGRLNTYEEGEHLLLCGVHASRYLGDRYHQARFLNHLGVLLCYHGELTRAQQVLKESLAIAEELGSPVTLWHPLCNLAHIAHISGEYDIARRFAEAYLQHMQQAGDPGRIAIALYKSGFYARLQGDRDRAYKDLASSVQHFSLRDSAQVLPHERIAELEALTEFARVQGDYARSQEYMEETIALVEEMCDRYSVADLLFDQACFAQQQGLLEEARHLALRVIDVAKQIGADHFYKRSMSLLRNVST